MGGRAAVSNMPQCLSSRGVPPCELDLPRLQRLDRRPDKFRTCYIRLGNWGKFDFSRFPVDIE